MKEIFIYVIGEDEFKDREYIELQNFALQMNLQLEKEYHITLQTVHLGDGALPAWKTEESIEKIRSGEAVFLLLHINAPELLKSFFFSAWGQFVQAGKPKIYTYLFGSSFSAEPETPAVAFLKQLYNDTGHYCGTYTHIDTIKLKLLQILKLDSCVSGEMTFRNGELTLDGNTCLVLDHIPMYANNDRLTELKTELRSAEETYWELKAKTAADDADQHVYRAYSEAAAAYRMLKRQIEDAEKELFDRSIAMLEAEDKPIDRQELAARRAFENGDAKGANAILDLDEMKDAWKREEERHEAENALFRKNLSLYMHKLFYKIQILYTLTGYEKRFSEIEAIYAELCEKAFRYDDGYAFVLDYVVYLKDRSRYTRAYALAAETEARIKEKKDVGALYLSLLENMCIITAHIPERLGETEAIYRKAFALADELYADRDAQKQKYTLMLTANLSAYYLKENDCLKAQSMMRRVIEEAQKNSSLRAGWLAVYYANYAFICARCLDPANADAYFRKAIGILKELYEETPERYVESYTLQLNNYAVFLSEHNDSEAARAALETSTGLLNKINQSSDHYYDSNLALNEHNAVSMRFSDGKTDDADVENRYLSLLEKYDELARDGNERMELRSAQTKTSLARRFLSKGDLQKAETYVDESLAVYLRLQDVSGSRRYAYQIAECMILRSGILREQKNNKAAFRELRRARAYLKKTNHTDDAEYMRILHLYCEAVFLWFSAASVFQRSIGYNEYAESAAMLLRRFLPTVQAAYAKDPAFVGPILASVYRFLYFCMEQRYFTALNHLMYQTRAKSYRAVNSRKSKLYYDNALEYARKYPDNALCADVIGDLTWEAE